MEGAHDTYYRECLLPLAAYGDGHVLAVTIAMLLAILTSRSDLCIAGVFGAGKTRSLAVMLIAVSCELKDFTAIVYTKENVAFFCSNALIALARSLCKCLLAVLIIASGADTVKGYLVRCACIDDTIP